MARPLVVVAVAGIGISIGLFALAAMLSPDGGFSYPFWSRHYDDSDWRGSRPPWTRSAPFTESGETVTREFGWAGGDSLEILIPGTVHYERAPQWSVTVKGPRTSVEHLRIEPPAILFDAPLESRGNSELQVHIKGPSLSHVALNGSGQLILEGVEQEDMAIDVRGSGNVHGSGTVRNLQLRIFGSGNAKLAELATEDIETKIFGSGNADVAPTGDVEVSIFGSGDVRLHAKPSHVSSKIFGSGRVVELEPDRGESQDSSPDVRAHPTQSPIPI